MALASATAEAVAVTLIGTVLPCADAPMVMLDSAWARLEANEHPNAGREPRQPGEAARACA
jgi:hypothetical protein